MRVQIMGAAIRFSSAPPERVPWRTGQELASPDADMLNSSDMESEILERYA